MPRSPRPIGISDDGELGHVCEDGTIVPFDAEDDAAFAEKMRVESERLECVKSEIYSAITDPENNEPFPMKFVLDNPEFIEWILGQKPDYKPTIVELRVIWPAYLERLRRKREKAIESERTADSKTDSEKPPKVPQYASENARRDKFAYDQAMKGKTWKSIKAIVGKRKKWQPLNTVSSVRSAVKRYAILKSLPLPPSRQPGRRAKP